jgi:hypothetical protein
MIDSFLGKGSGLQDSSTPPPQPPLHYLVAISTSAVCQENGPLCACKRLYSYQIVLMGNFV